MFNKNIIYYPKNIYLDLDFDKVKSDFNKLNTDCQDFGSIIIIKNPSTTVSINDIGKVQIFYDNINQSELNNNIKDIEKIFQNQINDFEIIMH